MYWFRNQFAHSLSVAQPTQQQIKLYMYREKQGVVIAILHAKTQTSETEITISALFTRTHKSVSIPI